MNLSEEEQARRYRWLREQSVGDVEVLWYQTEEGFEKMITDWMKSEESFRELA